jgi:hypothetical protein
MNSNWAHHDVIYLGVLTDDGDDCGRYGMVVTCGEHGWLALQWWAVRVEGSGRKN